MAYVGLKLMVETLHRVRSVLSIVVERGKKIQSAGCEGVHDINWRCERDDERSK